MNQTPTIITPFLSGFRFIGERVYSTWLWSPACPLCRGGHDPLTAMGPGRTWREQWREGKAIGEGAGIFSHLSIFKKRSNSSNNVWTSLPHTATKRDVSVDHSQLANVSSPRSHKYLIHPFPWNKYYHGDLLVSIRVYEQPWWSEVMTSQSDWKPLGCDFLFCSDKIKPLSVLHLF